MLVHLTTAGLTIIQGDWLPRLVPSLTTYGKPLEVPAPYYDVEVSRTARHRPKLSIVAR